MLHLHIGFHKAGSSTVQAFLRDNAPALAARGVVYPTAGLERRAGHHHLADAILAGRDLPEIAAIRAAAERGVVVLSSERFSQCGPAAVRAALGPARVICYRRDLISDPVSRYAQTTKRGRVAGSFDVQLSSGALSFSPASAVAAWMAAFGAVRLRSLAPDCLEGGELAADICAALGVDGAGLDRPGDRNLSPGWMPVEVLRAVSHGLGAAGADPATVADFVGRRLRKAVEAAAIELGLNARGLYLSADQIAGLAEADAADRARLDDSGADVRTTAPSWPAPRAFLPEASHIPPADLARLLAGARDRLAAPRRAGL